MTRPQALFFLFLIVLAVIAVPASASLTVDTTLKKVTAVYNTTVSMSSTTRQVPVEAYSFSVQALSALLHAAGTQTERSTNNSLSVGWGGLVVFYDNETNTTQEIQLGPGISDGYIIIEKEKVVEKIVEKPCPPAPQCPVTQEPPPPPPEPPTVTAQDEGTDWRVMGAGLAALAVLAFLLARRG